MKRFLLLLLIAIATFLIYAIFKNPDLLSDIWLWLIGLAGAIIQAGRLLIEYFKSIFDKKPNDPNSTVKPDAGNIAPESNIAAPLSMTNDADIRLSLLRYFDDGNTTLGLLYVNETFYCYTLEDSHHDVKIPGETRIPAGIYDIDFRKEVTPLTKTYQERYPDWFSFHIQLKSVPDFKCIYIHNGGDHTNTEGCILVSDRLNVSEDRTFLSNSRNTFKRFYHFIESQLVEQKSVKITVRDETWIYEISTELRKIKSIA